MNEVARKKERGSARGRSRRRWRGPYPVGLKLKAVKLYLEEGFEARLVARELGVTEHSLYAWAKAYREGGEAGLEPTPRHARASGKPTQAIRQKITEVKQQHPSFGVKRISQWLRRVLLLPASPETVRRTLHREGLMPKTRKKPNRSKRFVHRRRDRTAGC